MNISWWNKCLLYMIYILTRVWKNEVCVANSVDNETFWGEPINISCSMLTSFGCFSPSSTGLNSVIGMIPSKRYRYDITWISSKLNNQSMHKESWYYLHAKIITFRILERKLGANSESTTMFSSNFSQI